MKQLATGKEQLQLLLPQYDMLKKVCWETSKSVHNEKVVYADDVLKQMRAARYSTSTFEEYLVGGNHCELEAEWHTKFQVFAVIDKFGFLYNQRWNGELEFGEGSMLSQTLKQIVETKFIQCKQNLPTMCCPWTFHSPKSCSG